jgi:hypothetical protein
VAGFRIRESGDFYLMASKFEKDYTSAYKESQFKSKKGHGFMGKIDSNFKF